MCPICSRPTLSPPAPNIFTNAERVRCPSLIAGVPRFRTLSAPYFKWGCSSVGRAPDTSGNEDHKGKTIFVKRPPTNREVGGSSPPSSSLPMQMWGVAQRPSASPREAKVAGSNPASPFSFIAIDKVLLICYKETLKVVVFFNRAKRRSVYGRGKDGAYALRVPVQIFQE